MKKPVAILLVVLVIGITIVTYLVITSSGTDSNEPVPIGNPFDFASTTPNDRSEQLLLPLRGGAEVYVPDFTKENQPEIAGPETGYHVANAAEERYRILYFPQGAYFLVSLYTEPLGETRLAAESELRQKLQLSNNELCALNLEVRTNIYTNETYAGRNLGLSFCPGAVPLP